MLFVVLMVAISLAYLMIVMGMKSSPSQVAVV